MAGALPPTGPSRWQRPWRLLSSCILYILPLLSTNASLQLSSPPGRASILHCQGHIHQTVPNLCSSLRSPQIHSLPDPLLVDSIGIGGRRSILHPRSVRSPFSSNIHQWSRVPDSALGCAPTQPCSGCEQEGFCPRCVGIIRFIRLASVNAASYGVSHASLPIPPSLPVTANMSPDSSTLVHPFPHLYPASPPLLSPPEGLGQSPPLTHNYRPSPRGREAPSPLCLRRSNLRPQPSGELSVPSRWCKRRPLYCSPLPLRQCYRVCVRARDNHFGATLQCLKKKKKKHALW
jgi:hypothetical protein